MPAIRPTIGRALAIALLVFAALLLPQATRAATSIACEDAQSEPQTVSPANPCPVITSAAATRGNTGSLTATSSSATIASLYTANANNTASWLTSSGFIPAGGFYIRNVGASDVAFCIHGGTCTCAANAVSSSVGVTIQAGNGFGFFGYGAIAYNIPTIVGCSGSVVVEIDQ